MTQERVARQICDPVNALESRWVILVWAPMWARRCSSIEWYAGDCALALEVNLPFSVPTIREVAPGIMSTQLLNTGT